jgi:hypothetical protein
MARHQISQRGGRGDGLALAGLILGYLFTAITIVACGAVIATAEHCARTGATVCAA